MKTDEWYARPYCRITETWFDAVLQPHALLGKWSSPALNKTMTRPNTITIPETIDI